MQRNIFKFNLSGLYRFSWITFSVIATTIIVFVAEWIQRTGIVSVPLGFKHLAILILFLFNWIIFGRPLRLNQYYTLGILLILSYLVVAYVFVPVSIINYISGIGFTFLFVLMFVLGSNTKTNVSVIISVLKSLLVFFVLMSVLPILKALLAGTTLRHVNPGLFRELGAFGSSMNIGVIISLSLYIITGEKKYFYLSIFLSFGVFFTILKKSMLSNVIVWIAYIFFQLSSKLRLKLILYGISFFILTLSFVGDEIVNDIKVNVGYYKNVAPTEHVRLGMYIAGFHIAEDYFPFGSGMGTFGSLASIIKGYSQIYFDYGVSKIGMNSPEAVARGNYTLLDTYWPHILGELGFIGMVIFLSVWLFPLISTGYIMHLYKEPIIKGLGFYVVVIVLIMTNEGFTLYTPEIPSFVILHSGVAGLCYYHIKSFKTARLKESI